MPALAATPLGTRHMLRIQPRASRNAVVGRHGESIRIRLAAPPVDGAANEALVSYRADRLGVTSAAIALTRGHAARDKVVEVKGLNPEEVARRLGL